MNRNEGNRLEDRSASRSSSEAKAAGFAEKYVTPRASNASSSATSPGPRGNPMRAPAASGESMECAMAPAVYIGGTKRQTSPLSIGCARERAITCAWVSGTVLGCAVVPDVWNNIATSWDGGHACTTGRQGASVHRSKVPATASRRGTRRSNCRPSDRAVATAGVSVPSGAISAATRSFLSKESQVKGSSAGFIGTQAAPAINASVSTSASAPLGNDIATRVPRPMPADASTATVLSTSRNSPS
jgi:hypothetical protein